MNIKTQPSSDDEKRIIDYQIILVAANANCNGTLHVKSRQWYDYVSLPLKGFICLLFHKTFLQSKFVSGVNFENGSKCALL